MIQYRLKRSIIPLMQLKRRPLWRRVTSWVFWGLIWLAIMGYGLQRFSQ